jgi:Na+/H+-dicarboxylate symporter
LIPFVIFGLVATSIAESGLGLIGSLSLFMVTFISMLLIYVTGFYGTILTVISRPFIGFLKSRKELVIKAFTTSSSSAVMGVSIATARQNGIDEETANIVIPMGATVNMDGTAMYQIFVAMFLMVISGVDGTDVVSMLPVIVVIVLASMGTPGAPGASLFILMPILASMGIDTNLVLLILAVDRVLDMSRTVVNVMGDQVMAEVAYWWFHRRPGRE